MVIEALTKLYHTMLAKGEISPDGWIATRVGYMLDVDSQGNIKGFQSLYREEVSGTKKVILPAVINLPSAPVTVHINPRYMYGTADYVFGFRIKDGAKQPTDCHDAWVRHQEHLLKGLTSDTANGLRNFVRNWDPANNGKLDFLQDEKTVKNLMAGANILITVNGEPVNENEEIRNAYQKIYDGCEGEIITDAITGEKDVLALIHPKIHGVDGALATGSSLISFDKPSFRFCGKEQGNNFPIGRKTAFAYTSALNKLLSDRDHRYIIGTTKQSTTIVCWSEEDEPQYKDFMSAALGVQQETLTQEDVLAVMNNLAKGVPVYNTSAGSQYQKDKTFYVLGLYPSAGRIGVRFFYDGTFGNLLKNVNAHYERFRLQGAPEYIPQWKLLNSVSKPNIKGKDIDPKMAGDLADAIILGSRYPASLKNRALYRIYVEPIDYTSYASREREAIRIAILKAYYIQNPDQSCPPEVLTMSLNTETDNTAYVLGRLFAVYEYTHRKALPAIKKTVRDTMYSAAAKTPARIFAALDTGSVYQLNKIRTEGTRLWLNKLIGELHDKLGASLPVTLTVTEQSAFHLGYYHQRQSFFTTKNTESGNGQDDND